MRKIIDATSSPEEIGQLIADAPDAIPDAELVKIVLRKELENTLAITKESAPQE